MECSIGHACRVYTNQRTRSITFSQEATNSYFQIYPTAYLQYKQDENQSWNINYSRRIERPSFWYMNPFRVYSTATSYEEGNPFLQPSFSNNAELGYNFKSLLSINLFTQSITDVSTRISRIDTLHHTYIFTQANAGRILQYGCNITLSFKPLSFWESTTQLSGTYNKFSSSYYATTITYGKPSFFLATNNTFMLNHRETIQGEFQFAYTSGQQSDFDIQRSFCNLSIAIKTWLWNKKVALTFSAEDLLKTDKWQMTNLYNGTYQYSYFDNRLLRIALSWKFGNSGIKEKRLRHSDAEETRRAG